MGISSYHRLRITTLPPSLPACHGSSAPINANVRRRWRGKDTQAASETSCRPDHLFCVVDDRGSARTQHTPSDLDAQSTTTTEASRSPESFSSTRPRTGGSEHTRIQVQEMGRKHKKRVDSFFDNKDSVTDPFSSPLKRNDAQSKPTLSATSTSAEIVEALLPDRPVERRFPRRTASARYEREDKVEVEEFRAFQSQEVKVRRGSCG